jgi:hypothetical protein
LKRSPLKRSRKPLRRQSKRRRAERGPRARCIATVRQRAKGFCQAGCPKCAWLGMDAHELLPRSQGGDPLNPDGCIWVCRPCHLWIHAHPAKAYALGLLKRRSEAA